MASFYKTSKRVGIFTWSFLASINYFPFLVLDKNLATESTGARKRHAHFNLRRKTKEFLSISWETERTGCLTVPLSLKWKCKQKRQRVEHREKHLEMRRWEHWCRLLTAFHTCILGPFCAMPRCDLRVGNGCTIYVAQLWKARFILVSEGGTEYNNIKPDYVAFFN